MPDSGAPAADAFLTVFTSFYPRRAHFYVNLIKYESRTISKPFSTRVLLDKRRAVAKNIKGISEQGLGK